MFSFLLTLVFPLFLFLVFKFVKFSRRENVKHSKFRYTHWFFLQRGEIKLLKLMRPNQKSLLWSELVQFRENIFKFEIGGIFWQIYMQLLPSTCPL
jgi:hypothetical protein